MAKSEKKISIASLDKVLKEQAVDIATEQWFGNEVKIKHTLSFSEALAFVDDVVSSCFHTTGGYMPELQEFVVKSNILTRYANFNLPDNLEHRYSLLYNTDAVDVVIRHINQKQLDDILESISETITTRTLSSVESLRLPMVGIWAMLLRLLPSAIVHSMGMTITLCPSCMATAKTSSAVCSCLTLMSAVSMSMTPISN